MARYVVGNVSSRMPSGLESASSLDKRVSARLSQCVRIAIGSDLVFFVAVRKLVDASNVKRRKGDELHPDVFSAVQLHPQVLVLFPP
jgi:hypothetical protein